MPRNRARRESSAKGWTWNSRQKKKKKKQSSFFGVLTLFRQLRCYNGRDVFKNKKKKDIFAQASRRSRLNISKKKKEGRKNEGFGVRDRKKEILARINCRGNGED